MDSIWVSSLSALWLGILTSISPCPLATNIAAVSFISKRIERTKGAILTGLAYTIGRVVCYAVLAVIVISGLLSISGVAMFLQRYMNRLLGPVMIIAGVFLLDWIPLSFSNMIPGGNLQKRAESGGLWSAALLGVLFALSFCPTSAALFFGSLIPLAVKVDSRFLLPSLYGFGTGLPVLLFAVVIAFSTQSLGKWFNRLTVFERWARRVTGVIFLTIGVYFTVIYLF